MFVKSKLVWVLAGCTVLAAFIFIGVYKKKANPKSVHGISKAQVKEILVPIHQNIYRAFEKKNASDAYDLLALSLDGEMLSHVFAEVYSYFLEKEKGGPTVEIEAVKIRDLELLPASSGLLSKSAPIDVICSWDVLSVVTHFAHWHPRSNNFKARFQLKKMGGSWKLVQDEILWQQRIKLDLESFGESS